MNNVSCGCHFPSSVNTQFVISPGNLYFYKGTSSLTKSELEEIMRRSIDTFQRIGISPSGQEIVQGPRYPDLTGLDVMLFFVNYSPSSCIAQFRPHIAQWGLLKDQVPGATYSQKTIETNTGFIAMDEAVFIYDKYLRESVTPKRLEYNLLRYCDKIKYLASIATHEIAHAYAALDIFVRRKRMSEQVTADDPRIATHFMANPYLGTDQHFDNENIHNMRKFVTQVKIGEIQDIQSARDSLLLNNALEL